MSRPTKEEQDQRTALPTDIQPSQTQYLRVNNSFVRGSWNGMGPVAVTWSSGFSTSCRPSDWNDRLFVHTSTGVRLIQSHEEPQAQAWFAQLEQERLARHEKSRNPSRKAPAP